MLKKQVGIALLMIVSVAVMGCSSEKTDERNTLIQMAKQPPFYISVLSGKISTFYELDSYLIELINLLKGS